MCGIAGLIATTSGIDLEATVRRMSNVLVHRGPDHAGFWFDTVLGIALVHRRLSIIDLSPLGHQPMHSVGERYTIVFNGEIYNFEEIRAELESLNLAPVWRGRSDTEVLLAAIETWGFQGALTRAVGMFAIALWDRENSTLLLARDRIGEKPLYYGNIKKGFVFTSELKAIRAIADDTLELNKQAISEYMRFGYVPRENCIYNGLFKLLPGHWVRVESNGQIGKQNPYWQLDSRHVKMLRDEIVNADDENLISHLHDRLYTSVGVQMMADVPLGAFLSGGVDSSMVVALMQAQSTRRVKTFTIGFYDKKFDEAPFARAVAQHLGTEHTELYVSAEDATALIPRLPAIYDEPFADSSQIPTTLVSQLTRQHVTVSLSGDGGDELFAGYPRYSMTESLWNRINYLPAKLRSSVSLGLRYASPSSWDLLFRMLPAAERERFNGRRVHRLAQLLKSKSLAEMYIRLMSQWQPEDELVLGMGQYATNGPKWSALGTSSEQMRHWDMMQYLPDDLLVKVDRASMSASLEARAPLLDHRLVELAFALPPHVLKRKGQGKWILRRVLDRYVPRELIDRPKAGFAVPLAHWLRGPLREWASDLLNAQKLRREGLLDADKVSTMWNEHENGHYDRSGQLWNVLMFLAWKKAHH
jgi:asparagine synthase (glutamine-hydrolysing)